MADSDDTPVYKITIQRESPSKDGEPKFSLVPQNFTLPGQTTPLIPVPLSSESLCPSSATTPVFSSGSYMKCAVPNCNNYFDGQRCEFMGISYFPFPQEPDLRQEWITAIDLPPDKDLDQLKVCSDHFMNKDFVSDFIEVEDGPEETNNPKRSKPQENIELKPGVKPTVKLGEAQKNNMMAEYAKEAWEKNVTVFGDKSKRSEGKLGTFSGLENPLMDTANELRSSVITSVTSAIPEESDSSTSVDKPSTTADTEVPIITSVGTIRPATMDDNFEVSVGNKSQKEIDRERASAHGTLVDVVEVEDDEEDMVEEALRRKLAWNTKTNQENTEQQLPSEARKGNESSDQGLINVPASVKLPPRKTITGDSSSTAPRHPPEPVPSTSKNDTTLPCTSDVMPSSSSWLPDPPALQKRTRRRRRTRAEMQKQEDEDEWEPTLWSKKTLVKEGYGFEPKRRVKPFVTTRAPKNMDTSDDEEGLEEFDEGFRIDEPISSSPEKRRKPGPASKTSRPQYVPPASEQKGAANIPKNGVVEKDLEEVLADKSLLVEWAFFKSLIPDLKRMSQEKRDELKTFMLDTLNSRIYEGKPIMPNIRDPVKI